MFNEAVNTSPSAIQFIPEYCKPQEMCVKDVYTCFVVFNAVLDQYKAHEMCDTAIVDFYQH